MTRDEARLLIDATTLRPQDAGPELRRLLERDRRLRAWQQSRARFDRQMAGLFTRLPVRYSSPDPPQ